MGQNKSKERKSTQEISSVNDDDKTDNTAIYHRIENQSDQTVASTSLNKRHHYEPTKKHETGSTPQCITERVDNPKNKSKFSTLICVHKQTQFL